ncbi:DUF6934 family protein [Empedobacter sp. ULE_I140]
MEEIINQSYNYELIESSDKRVVYNFTSKGEKDIIKRVFFDKIFENSTIYNLSFGNVVITEEGEDITDKSRDNNSDVNKVLSTVFSCTIDFLSRYSNSRVILWGNTESKNRLYKMSISNNLKDFNGYLKVYGCIFNNMELNYDNEGFKTPNFENFSFSDIISYNYDKNNSKDYNFVLINVDDLK